MEEIEDDLSQFVRVGTGKGQLGRERGYDTHAAFGGEEVKIFDGLGDHVCERHRFQAYGGFAHFDLREIQQIIDQDSKA